jgi:dUTP pyrophosphatase
MMNKIIVCVKDPQLLPERQTISSVCRDLRASIDFSVNPGEMIGVSAGVKTHIPHGRQSKVYARSGLPSKCHLMLANSVAVFDADYRGEYILQFFNYTKDIVHHEKYTRLCQIEFMPYYV